MNSADTIASIATPPGRGGVAIIRVSGPLALTIGSLITKTQLKTRYGHYLRFYTDDGEVLDQGIALAFAGPHSFTGEDVLELHGHGGPVIMDLLLQEVLKLGARSARPGEFSERAFLNDKMDLSQAEAIADLINASTAQAARSAIRSLQGVFSILVGALTQKLIELRMHVEAAIDFPEEEIDFLADKQLHQRLQDTLASIDDLQEKAQQGQLLRDGFKVVIAGKPNAGKSSLLNCLTGEDTAIVTDVPGTTRDVLRAQIHLDGIPIHLVDTAGLRTARDQVEKIGVARAKEQIDQADVILLVIDATDFDLSPFTEFLSDKTLVIRNKCDLLNEGYVATEGNTLAISATEKIGLDELKKAIKTLVGVHEVGENTIIARRRHLTAIKRAKAHLYSGMQQLTEFHSGELLAEECRLAQLALSEITGKFTPDDLLGEIFSRFCIGK